MWKRLVLPARCLFRFIRYYSSHQVSCRMLTKVCRVPINYLKLLCFLHFPLTVWSHNFTGCSQGGKVTFGNTLCTFKDQTLSLWLSGNNEEEPDCKTNRNWCNFSEVPTVWGLPCSRCYLYDPNLYSDLYSDLYSNLYVWLIYVTMSVKEIITSAHKPLFQKPLVTGGGEGGIRFIHI